MAINFYDLDPDKVLKCAESAGFEVTGEFTQLNSYENRVFDIKTEDQNNVIAKFYRPQRWSQECIQEEHQFLLDLKQEGIHAVAPLILKNKKTVLNFEGIFVGFFPKVRGRMPQELFEGDLKSIGRLLARVHNIGASQKAKHRPILNENYHGSWQSLDLLQDWITPELIDRYNDAAESILFELYEQLEPEEFLRLHGDCHRGNLLNTGSEYFLVDFDDFFIGPAIQDFWMLYHSEQELDHLRSGYEDLREFPDHQLSLVPYLRGLRIISYAAWIAKRWSDPSFPRLFPDFNSYTYWAEEVEALEKIAWEIS